jgi:hypothetical protein
MSNYLQPSILGDLKRFDHVSYGVAALDKSKHIVIKRLNADFNSGGAIGQHQVHMFSASPIRACLKSQPDVPNRTRPCFAFRFVKGKAVGPIQSIQASLHEMLLIR